MPVFKQSDRVRAIIMENYVKPAVRAGSNKLSIRAGDVLRQAEANNDFPRGRTPLVCTVLQSKKLLTEAGLELISVDGPPSLQSRTVVVHYKVLAHASISDPSINEQRVSETPSQRAFRLTEKLRGLMKDEIAAHGGTEGFMRWVRSDEDEETG
jgi:hypothetical protein